MIRHPLWIRPNNGLSFPSSIISSICYQNASIKLMNFFLLCQQLIKQETYRTQNCFQCLPNRSIFTNVLCCVQHLSHSMPPKQLYVLAFAVAGQTRPQRMQKNLSRIKMMSYGSNIESSSGSCSRATFQQGRRSQTGGDDAVETCCLQSLFWVICHRYSTNYFQQWLRLWLNLFFFILKLSLIFSQLISASLLAQVG